MSRIRAKYCGNCLTNKGAIQAKHWESDRERLELEKQSAIERMERMIGVHFRSSVNVNDRTRRAVRCHNAATHTHTHTHTHTWACTCSQAGQMMISGAKSVCHGDIHQKVSRNLQGLVLRRQMCGPTLLLPWLKLLQITFSAVSLMSLSVHTPFVLTARYPTADTFLR